MIEKFLTRSQHSTILSASFGEEGQFFRDKIKELERTIKSAPGIYGQDGSKDPTVYLHYFHPCGDWYITEIDLEGGQHFGYASLNGHEYEMGYIYLPEILRNSGVELDLHFSPKPWSQVS